jgi:enoyl-CoA hydratase/carnithine racemase
MVTSGDTMSVVGDDTSTTGLRLRAPLPGVAVLTLDRPERLNALDTRAMAALPSMLGSLAADPQVRALVLTGAGGVFCAGGDLEAIGSLPAMAHDDRRALLELVFRATTLLYELPKPTIAAISGPVAGGGVGLALACDIRLAGADATFVSPFVNMGLVPDYGTSWLLPRTVGQAFALEMAVTGRRVGAEEAVHAGLVSRLCADPLAEAVNLARQMATKPPRAVAATKRLMRDSADQDLAAGLAAEVDWQNEELGDEEFLARWSAWREAVGSRRPG